MTEEQNIEMLVKMARDVANLIDAEIKALGIPEQEKWAAFGMYIYVILKSTLTDYAEIAKALALAQYHIVEHDILERIRENKMKGVHLIKLDE